MVEEAPKRQGFEFDVHCHGLFLLDPLRYDGNILKVWLKKRISYVQMVEYLKVEIMEERFVHLYFLIPGNNVGDGLLIVENDKQLGVLYDVASDYGQIELFVDHLGVDIRQFLGKYGYEHLEEETTVNQNFGTDSGSDDLGSVDDDGSVASLDHLSEGEEEVYQVRKKKLGKKNHPKPKKAKLPRGYGRKMVDDKVQDIVQGEHDEFIEDLLSALNKEEDPLNVFEDVFDKFPVYDKRTHWKCQEPVTGERFEGVGQFKDCITFYALAKGFSIWYERSGKKDVIVRCGTRPPRIEDPEKGKQRKTKRYPKVDKNAPKDCNWRCYARWMNDEASFQIISMNDDHTCSRNFQFGSLVNYKWIGRNFGHKIRRNPDIKLCEIADMVMKKYNCEITPNVCRSAKIWALNEYEKSLADHYGMLRSYADELIRSNPGSTVKLGVTVNPDESTTFERFYVCLHGLKEGWKIGCRRIIALDGCFLKGPCHGELITAIGRDGNNHIFPVAWAVITVENKDNWSWFLELLGDDLGMPTGNDLTLMSDQHKGLMEVVKDIMPNAEHRQCARHIYDNFRKAYSGVEFRNLFWQACRASYTREFERVMSEIRIANHNAYNHLIKKEPKTWSRAFFEVGRGCEAVENGFSECFNSVLLKVRHKPIITMLEAIRHILMERMNTMNKISAGWCDDITPCIRKRLELTKDQICHWRMIVGGRHVYEVTRGFDSFVVDEANMTCTCRMWQLSGIPCVHAMKVILGLNKTVEDFVPTWFKKSLYRSTYSFGIQPLKGMNQWEINDINKPHPPIPKRMPGRPKKKRQRAAHELITTSGTKSSVTRMGIKMTCQLCHQTGHNKRGCKVVFNDGVREGQTGGSVNNATCMDQPSIPSDEGKDKGRGKGKDKGKGKCIDVNVILQPLPKRRRPSERIANQVNKTPYHGPGATQETAISL